MLILAIETSADVCSIAVRDSQGLLVERAFRHRMHVSERVLNDVSAVLEDAGGTLAGIDALAVGIGPGSFTGVRIGVMTVKTWADVLQKPVCGVSALDIVAQQNLGHTGVAVVPVIRARPGAIYAAIYRRQEDAMRAESEPGIVEISHLSAMLGGDANLRYLLVGDALARSREAIATELDAAGIDAAFGSPEAPRAGVLAEIAASRIASGDVDDPLALNPLYVAPPPIDPRAERKTGV